MTWLSALWGTLVFCGVMVGSYALLLRWLPSAHERRLQGLMDRPASPWPRLQDEWRQSLTALLLRLSHWSAPEDSAADKPVHSPTASRLVQAGWRQAHALAVFYGLKTALTLLVPGLVLWMAWLLRSVPTGTAWFALTLLTGAAGYYLPELGLRWAMARRQRHVLHVFPDALDLLRVCVQAGLGLDAAIDRVGRDMRLSSAVLAEEFALTGLELRAGLPRAMALQHLSERIGLKDIEALVAMLVQADRFGSSISESLRVYSEALRTKRRLIAEEAAAKLPVKLLIPLIFCIFPTLLTVLIGPVVISFQQHFHPQAMGG
jgi:tight adherence protein C